MFLHLYNVVLFILCLFRIKIDLHIFTSEMKCLGFLLKYFRKIVGGDN